VSDQEEVQADVYAEQSVLGAMMLSADAVWTVLDVIEPTDMYQPRHELICRAISTLANSGRPTDVIAVTDELERTGLADRAGGAPYLHELTTTVTTPATAAYHADVILTRATRRRLMNAGLRITDMGRATEGDPLELVEEASRELATVARTTSIGVKPVGDMLPGFVSRLERPPVYRATGLPSLDKKIGGLAPGAMYVVAARPGEGKSIMGMQFATALARHGSVAYCSLEMSTDDLMGRLIAQFGEIHMTALREHRLNREQWMRVENAKRALNDAPIYINDDAMTLGAIRQHVREVSRSSRVPLAGVIVDYLQLMEGSGRSSENREQQVAQASRGLKLMAKTYGVPVVALSQLKRAPDGRQSRTPLLTDLRESGSIEQDADVVLGLNYDRAKSLTELEVSALKNRHGELGRVVLEWQGKYARVRDPEWTPEVPLDGMPS
jgi:replicative DNA helicase